MDNNTLNRELLAFIPMASNSDDEVKEMRDLFASQVATRHLLASRNEVAQIMRNFASVLKRRAAVRAARAEMLRKEGGFRICNVPINRKQRKLNTAMKKIAEATPLDQMAEALNEAYNIPPDSEKK